MTKTKKEPKNQEVVMEIPTPTISKKRAVRSRKVPVAEKPIEESVKPVQEQQTQGQMASVDSLNQLLNTEVAVPDNISSSVKKSVFTRKWIIISSALVIIVIASLGYFLLKKDTDTVTNSATTTQQKTEEIKKKTDAVVKKISDLLVITDSTNAVSATIADKTKLSNQRFFDLAQNGDDLVLFPNMKKAVLYRSSVNKIVDIGPFNPPNQKENTNSVSATSTVKR